MNGGNGGIGNQPDRFFTGGVSGNGGQGNFNISNNGTAANRLQNIDCIAIEVQMDGPVTMTSTVHQQLHQRQQRRRLRGDRRRHRRPERPRRRHPQHRDLREQRDGHQRARASSRSSGTPAAPCSPGSSTTPSRPPSRPTPPGPGSASTPAPPKATRRMCLEITGNTTAGSTNTGTAHHLTRHQPAQAGHRPNHQHLRDRGDGGDQHPWRRELRQRAEHQHVRHLRHRRHGTLVCPAASPTAMLPSRSPDSGSPGGGLANPLSAAARTAARDSAARAVTC